MLFYSTITPFYYIRSDNAQNINLLSPGQTIAKCQWNMSQLCCAQHVACVWLPCCDVLRHFGCCVVGSSFKMVNCEPITPNMSEHIATLGGQTHVTCCGQQFAICCVDMLRSFGRGFTNRERTGRYWREVVVVQAERHEFRRKTTEWQFYPVQLERHFTDPRHVPAHGTSLDMFKPLIDRR